MSIAVKRKASSRRREFELGLGGAIKDGLVDRAIALIGDFDRIGTKGPGSQNLDKVAASDSAYPAPWHNLFQPNH